MRYFKTTQPIPGQGDAFMYYECEDDLRIRRYFTHIPATGQVKKVSNPFVKTLQDPDSLMEATQEEFAAHWPEEFEGEAEKGAAAGSGGSGGADGKHFSIDMTIGHAMGIHPRVAEVFAAFHLGGCAHCGISEIETIGQVCAGYGVDVDMLLEVLEGLMAEEQGEASPAST